MSRRLVTVFGGSGFIGRHVIQRLVKQGAQIRVATRDTEATGYLKPLGEIGQITPVPTSFSDEETIARALRGADQAINLIGILFNSRKSSFTKIHVDVAHSIAKAATNTGVKSLVHVSALGASANSNSLYARSKAAGESAVRDAFKDAVIVRPSAVFGREDNFFNLFASIASFSPALPVFGCPTIPRVKFFGSTNSLISIDLFGDGGTRIQPVYVSDVAEAIIKILEDKKNNRKIFELGGPTIYSFKNMMELVLKESERSRILFPYPFAIAKFFAWFLEFLPKPLMTRDQVELLKTDNVVSGAHLGFDHLEIKPAAAEAILPTYIRQYRPTAKRHFRRA